MAIVIWLPTNLGLTSMQHKAPGFNSISQKLSAFFLYGESQWYIELIFKLGTPKNRKKSLKKGAHMLGLFLPKIPGFKNMNVFIFDTFTDSPLLDHFWPLAD